MKTFDVAVISQDLEQGKYYNLLGLINSEPFFSSPVNGMTKQRFSVIDLDRKQLLIEIWNDKRELEIEFARDWRILQMIFIENAKYHGIMQMGAEDPKIVHIFKISSKNQNRRFIWLSSPSPHFWLQPLLPRNLMLKSVETLKIAEIEELEAKVITLEIHLQVLFFSKKLKTFLNAIF